MNLTKMALVGALAFVATACDMDKDNNDKNDAEQLAEIYAADPELQNDWQSECRALPMIDPGYQRTEYRFSGIDFEHYVRFYSQEGCKDVAAELRYTGTVDSIDKVDGEDYANINLNYEDATMHVLNQDGADLLNLLDYCDIEWNDGDERDITKVERNALNCFHNEAAMYYDIIDREGSSVYFGSGIFGATKDRSDRPSELNTDIEYFKK